MILGHYQRNCQEIVKYDEGKRRRILAMKFKTNKITSQISFSLIYEMYERKSYKGLNKSALQRRFHYKR